MLLAAPTIIFPSDISNMQYSTFITKMLDITNVLFEIRSIILRKNNCIQFQSVHHQFCCFTGDRYTHAKSQSVCFTLILLAIEIFIFTSGEDIFLCLLILCFLLKSAGTARNIAHFKFTQVPK